MTISADQQDFESDAVQSLRDDLALALRAAAQHGLAEGVCNHFSVELPDGSGRFLLNPRGLLWSEIQADDIVLVDGQGGSSRAATRSSRPRCSSTPPIHRLGAQGLRAAHPHAVRDRADADRRPLPRHHAVAERDALPRPRRRRCALQRPGARRVRGRAHRRGDGRRRRRLPRQPRRHRLRRAHGPRLRRPLLPGARLHGPGAGAVDRPAAGAGRRRDRRSACASRRSANGCSPSCSSRRCAAARTCARSDRSVRNRLPGRAPSTGRRMGGDSVSDAGLRAPCAATP